MLSWAFAPTQSLQDLCRPPALDSSDGTAVDEDAKNNSHFRLRPTPVAMPAAPALLGLLALRRGGNVARLRRTPERDGCCPTPAQTGTQHGEKWGKYTEGWVVEVIWAGIAMDPLYPVCQANPLRTRLTPPP